MGVDWISGRLSDLAEIVMGQSPNSDTCNNRFQGTPLLNGPTEFGSHHPLPVQFTLDPKKFSKHDDILFCVRGSTTGRMNWSDREYAIGRGIAAIRHKKGKEYKHFIKGILELELPSLLASATGSTFPNISKEQLLNLKFKIPPLAEQKEIAHILGNLDDKIELNRQMNQTLEAMAKAIFKSWFVDFDPVKAKMEGRQPEGMDAATAELFPDSFEESVLGLIPKGWKIGTIETECDLTMGQSPKSEFYNINGEGLPFHQGVTNFEKRFPIHKIFCKISHRIAQQGDILLSVRAPVGRINIADTEIIIGRGLSAIRHKKNYHSMLFYQLQDFFKEEDCIGTGTVYTAVTKQEIQNIKLLVPLNNLGAFFNAKIKLIDNMILNNVIQSRTLTNLRDSLLPKLMSGEIRVKEAERVINDVVQI